MQSSPVSRQEYDSINRKCKIILSNNQILNLFLKNQVHYLYFLFALVTYMNSTQLKNYED